MASVWGPSFHFRVPNPLDEEATFMKTHVIVVLLALSLGARVAEAEGFNVAWDKCQAAGGTTEKVFDCADIAALDNIVVSFKPAANMPGFVGLEAVLGVTGTAPLPEYWQMGTAGCNALGCVPLFAVSWRWSSSRAVGASPASIASVSAQRVTVPASPR